MSGNSDSIVDLLQRWHAGDRGALDELIARNLDWVRAHVHRRLGDGLRRVGDTQDFVQDAMVEVLEYGPKFIIADGDRFRGLLARIVENCLREEHRRMHRQQRDPARERGVVSDTVLRLDPPQKEVTRPSQSADKNERLAWVRLALELLSPGDREVIWHYEMEGQTFQQIATSLGITEEGVRKRFHRAMPRLLQKVAQLQQGNVAGVLDHGY